MEFTAVAAGWYHTLAIKNDSTVWAWGSNMGGELGMDILLHMEIILLLK